MMNKVNAACQSLVAETRKNVFGRLAGQQVQSANNKSPKPSSLNEVLVIGKPGTTVTVSVTSEGSKSSSAMGSSRKAASVTSKITEDSHDKHWSKKLREQSRPAVKQGVQQLAAQTQSSKHSRHENPERKEIKTMMETHKTQRYIPQDNRILDEIPVKQAARKPIAIPTSAIPSTTTIASSTESVEVTDRGVQCGGIFDRSNERFSRFNPVRTIGFLLKEMEGLVRDERASKILTEIEQALLRIPPESGKSAPVVPLDLEVITLRAQLDATTAKLAETSSRIEATCATQREEIESLLQQVNKQALILEEAKQRERHLESAVKQIKMELNDAVKSEAESRRTILQLENEKKNSIEVTEKMVTELRRELNEQIKLAEDRFMEVQYLQLDREKFMALSSYKDSILIELRTALKKQQNLFSEQLIDIREAGKRVKDIPNDHQGSIIVGGAACSSPTSSCSINSIVPASCAEGSEISLSTVDCFPNSVPPTNEPLPKSQLPSSYFNGLLDNSETGRACDKTQLEFVSLAGGEISHAISLSQRKDDEGNLFASSRKKEQPTSDCRVEGFHSVPNLGGRNARDSLHRVDRDNSDSQPKSKTRKSSSAEKRRSGDAKSMSNREEDKRTSVDRASGDPASIKEQFEMIFEDIKQQSKLPLHVPNPPRDFPRPDWSDSSLPTMSGISESNVV